MSSRKIFWGIFFTTLGLLWLTSNLGWLNFNFHFIRKFWPLIFVFWGISKLIQDEKQKWILFGLTALLLCGLIFFSIKNGWIEIENSFSKGKAVVENFSEPYDSTVKKVEFSLDAGAGEFVIGDTTSQLLSAHTESGLGKYFVSTEKKNETEKISLRMKSRKFSWGNGKFRNRAEIKLNTNPVWDMDFDIGAASADLDLSPYKTKNVSIDAGAASLKVKLGNRSSSTKLSIDAGASSVTISIPESSGCEINTDTGLASMDFIGFKKIESHLYRTSNFDSTANKIFIDVDAGASSIKVIRY